MNPTKLRRSPALDVVRCIALLSVVSVHFFMNSGYYYSPVQGVRMYVMTLIRTASMICVPLFLMLSGFLLRNKRPEKAYYLTLVRTLGIYVLASIVSTVYRVFVVSPGISFADLASRFFKFTLPEYGWYIKMYIGLFLLIPYLNILYHGLGSQRQKQYLLLVLLILTAGPSIGNMDAKYPVVPDWWVSLYPVTYYYIGSYLREYPLKLRPAATGVLFLLACVAAGTLNYHFSHGEIYVWGIWQSWGSAIHVVLGVLAFHFLTALDYRRVPPLLSGWLARMSDWSLGAYLVSWIFDNRYYGILKAQVADVHLRLNYYPVMVLAVFFSSLALSAILNGIYALTLKKLPFLNQKTSST